MPVDSLIFYILFLLLKSILSHFPIDYQREGVVKPMDARYEENERDRLGRNRCIHRHRTIFRDKFKKGVEEEREEW